jgi:hypothetical protein
MGGVMAAATLTYFEPYVFLTSDKEEDVGFFSLSGPAETVYQLIQAEPTVTLQELRPIRRDSVDETRWEA